MANSYGQGTEADDRKEVEKAFAGQGKVVILARSHIHQIADVFDSRNRDINVQVGDIGSVLSSSIREYTIDSQHVDWIGFGKASVVVKAGGMKAETKDNLATTGALYNGSFSILKDAIKVAGGKPQ